MLDECARGYGRRETEHAHHVTYNKKTFRTLPLGKHGNRQNPEIESGHVRAMARHLAIEDCAKKHLPNIY